MSNVEIYTDAQTTRNKFVNGRESKKDCICTNVNKNINTHIISR